MLRQVTGKVISQNKTRGFTLIEMAIVLLLLSVLLAIAIPSLMRARSNAQINACKTHLWHIRDAKQRWAMENRKTENDMPSKDDLYPSYLKTWPECPAGGIYGIGTVDQAPECSIGEDHAIE